MYESVKDSQCASLDDPEVISAAQTLPDVSFLSNTCVSSFSSRNSRSFGIERTFDKKAANSQRQSSYYGSQEGSKVRAKVDLHSLLQLGTGGSQKNRNHVLQAKAKTTFAINCQQQAARPSSRLAAIR